MANIAPIPINSPVLNGKYLSGDYYQWLFQLQNRTQTGRQFIGSKVLTNQSAAITTTALALPALVSGYYALSYYARITAADGVSSSLTVTLGWTESTIGLSLSGAPMTGNTTATVQAGNATVLIDGNTALTYATAYSSNTPGQMKYRLTVMVESVST